MTIRGLSHEGLTLLYIADGICKCLPYIVVTLPSFLSSFPSLPPENKEENDYQRNTASLLLMFLPITAKSFPRIVYFFISSL